MVYLNLSVRPNHQAISESSRSNATFCVYVAIFSAALVAIIVWCHNFLFSIYSSSISDTESIITTIIGHILNLLHGNTSLCSPLAIVPFWNKPLYEDTINCNQCTAQSLKNMSPMTMNQFLQSLIVALSLQTIFIQLRRD